MRKQSLIELCNKATCFTVNPDEIDHIVLQTHRNHI